MARQPIDLAYAVTLEPRAAVEYFRGKGYRISDSWTDTLGRAHARAFTVARASRLDVLTAIRGEVDRAISEGRTAREFARELTPTLQRLGWWGREVRVDDQGGAEVVQLGSPRRLRTIYRANVGRAYAAGRWRGIEAAKDRRPYVRRIEVMDQRTRPEHRALHNKVWRVDDPALQSFWAPDDWGCRGRMSGMSQRALDAAGLPVEDSAGRIGEEEVVARVDKRTGEEIRRRVKTYRTGVIDPETGAEIIHRPGVGWDHNPGREAWQPDLDSYPLEEARQYLEGVATGPDFARFFAGRIGGEFPVAALAPAERATLGLERQTLWMDTATRDAQLADQAALALADYQALPGWLADADLVVRDGARLLLYVRRGDTIYRADIAPGTGAARNRVTALRRASLADARRANGRGVVLRDRLPL